MLHDFFEEPHGEGSSRGKTSGEQAGPGKDTYRHWFFPGVGRHRVAGSSGGSSGKVWGCGKGSHQGKTSVEQAGPGTDSHRHSVGGGHILTATGFSLGWAGAACPGFLGDCEGQPYPYRANNV